MQVMTRHIVDLKDEILTEIDKTFNDFKIVMIAELLEKKLRKGKNRNLLYASETLNWQSIN